MKLRKFFAVKQPCTNCPFLKKNGIELAEGRLESIKQGLFEDDQKVFQCHKTTFSTGGYYDDDYVYHASGKESFCAGAMGWLLLKGRPNVAMRLAYVTGHIDLNKLKTVVKDLIAE
ncbi:hypothetical protein [Xenorhabdus szentirmaii]|uniref:Uncharacterized protein n=1 Tax=Xenorhabdus szentirmaii DSM 16338 TaxID=1427518 RepID=W1ITT1_9GAMM|nr:hypothetical protein [Xenorhabdus szentirmaii]PHM30548.1 hypothetical protein Xsze_04138 [Xenorhabdus szentirmaii DSM 16338]CDL81011.1 conserved hypothetical protein [Xenorhabdus szentirmaii DSM 16338]